MKVLPVEVVGGSYVSRSRQLSAQETINLYPEFNPSSRSPSALQNWFGSIRQVTQSGADRGSCQFNGLYHKVSGNVLYSVSSDFVETSIGTIAGTNRCIFADDGTNLVIATGGVTYNYNGSLSEIADSDLETPTGVAILNNRFIFDGDGQRFVPSAVGDPTDIPVLDYQSAESVGDDLVRPYVFNQIAYMFGTKSIEPFDNRDGEYNRIDGGIIQKGLGATYSLANTNSYIYFVGDDKNIYRLFNYQLEKISTTALSNQLEGIDITSDAVGLTLSIANQDFYVFSSANLGKTFAFSEQMWAIDQGLAWIQLSYGVDGDRYLANSYQFIYNRHLITDYRNGNVLELDINTYSDDSEIQVRQRITAPINGKSLGLPGATFVMDYFELEMETGVGLATGQGSSPIILFSYSIDGGHTFSAEGYSYISPGHSGQRLVKVRYDNMVTFQDLVIKIRITDPIFISIHSARISVDLAGY